MKRTSTRSLFSFLLCLCIGGSLRAQLTGIQTVPGTFPSLTAAITALNTSGVGSGGATINVAAGYTENLSGSLILTMGTNAPTLTNPLVIQKSGAGANPVLTAHTGVSTTLDGMFVLNGVDYVTIDGIDLLENAANTTATMQMEWGYALVKSAAANGSQYNTIKNCVVTLSNANTASVGIYSGNHTSASTTGLTITASGGTNSFNRFYNNTIQNAYTGISITGFASAAPFDFYDQGNQVGRDGVSTNRNQVINFGGGATTANGVVATNQNGIKVFGTYVNTGSMSSTGTLNGVFLNAGTNSHVDVYNDTIALTSAATTSIVSGINNAMGGTGAGSIVNIYNNVVTGCTAPSFTSGEFRGIASTSTASYTNMYGNIVSNNTIPGTGQFSALYVSGNSATLCLSINLNDNIISNNTKTGTAGQFNCIFANASASQLNCFNNTLTTNSAASTSGPVYGYYNFNVGLAEVVYNNTINGLVGGSNITSGLTVAGGPTGTGGSKEVYGNTVSAVSGNSTGNPVGGIDVDWGNISNIYKNRVFDITNTTTTGVAGASHGIGLGTNLCFQTTCSNNFVSDIKAPNASNTNAALGIWLLGSATSLVNVYYNTVYLNAASIGANFGTSALTCGTGAGYDLRNNILVNTSTPMGTGLTRGITKGSTVLTNYALASGYNCIYAGTPGASNIIYSDGTNNDQTLQAFKNRVGPREQASFSSMPPFINSAVAPYDVHLQTATATQCEGGAKTIAGYTQDYDGTTRGATPDVGADEINGMTTDIASPDIQYTLLSNASVAATRPCLSFATITDPSGINTTAGTKPRIYYKKSTNANTYNDNTSGTDGWKYAEASNSSSPFSFTIDYSILFGSGVVAGDIIQYFVVAQDLNGTPITGLNNGGFTVVPSSVNLAAGNFPLTNTINQYTIVANTYSGVVNIGPAETITSLTNAGGMFALINAGVLSGNLTLNITGDLTVETGANALNQWAEEGSGNYSVSIVPSAAVTRTISGSNAGGALIRFDGADRVIVDGRFGGSGSYLTFRNTSNSTPTFTLLNDAQNNIIQYSIIESGNTATSVTAGGAVLIGSTSGANGNDNNTIAFCEIRDRSDVTGTPTIGINCVGLSTGTVAQYNNNCIISDNNIHDWFLANNANQFGVNVGVGNSGFDISGNSFYQTSTRTNTVSGAAIRAININYTAAASTNGGFNISNNYVGGTAPGATGGNMTLTVSGAGVSQAFIGISVVSGLIPNSIQNNVIRNIDYTTNAPAAAATIFAGMNLGQGNHNVGTITGNIIGGSTGNDLIRITINAGGSVNSFLAGILSVNVNGTTQIQNNTIGGITVSGTTITGGIIPQWIQVQGTPAQNYSISNNLIGSLTTPNSIQLNATAPAVVAFAIRNLITTGAGCTISNNTIQNLSNASANASTADYGMLLISTVGSQGTLTMTNNTIRNYTSSGLPAAPALNTLGISVQGYGGLTHTISGNRISGLSNSNAGAGQAYVVGIQTQGSSMGGDMSNNNIWDLRNSNTGASPGAAGVYFSAGLNWTLNNNRISVSNGANTNSVDVSGITDVMGANARLTMNYNSVYVGGSAAAGTFASYSYVHSGNSTINLKNNLLYNERTGGTGNHVAIGNTSATPAAGWAISNNNAFVSSDSTKIGVWNTTAVNLAGWRTNSGTDANSIASNSAGVTSANLFVSTANGDLHINTSTFPEALAAPIALVTTDYDGDARSATFPTIGSDERPCSNVIASAGTLSNITCFGANDGSVTVNVSGGNGITYSWAPSGGTAATASSLAPGTYTCTINNICGNSTTFTATITQPTAVTASVSSQTNVSCNGGTNGEATVSASGGTGAFTYSWAPTGGTAATESSLPAGNYTCTITDANMCATTQVVTITEPAVLVASADSQTDVSCNGGSDGSATVTVSGGTTSYSYSWSPSGGTAATANGLTAGNYTCTVTDANLCSTTQAFIITEPVALTSSLSSQTDVLCNGASTGSATVLAAGGTGALTYSWTPSGGTGATETGLAAGNYTCTTTDANNCTSITTVTITEPTAISASTSSTNSNCGLSNGSASVSAGGGTGTLTYSWTPSGGTGATETGLAAGSYTVTITDDNMCTISDVATVSDIGAPLVTSAPINVSCNGLSDGSIDNTVSGGAGSNTYNWSTSASTEDINSLPAGVYTYTVTDGAGCSATGSITITEPAAIDVSTSLAAETISANATGATYQWLDCDNANAPIAGETNQSYTATANGNYAVVVTQGACSDTSVCVNIATIGLSKTTAQSSVSIYPNPNDGHFVIRSTADGSYKLINSLSQVIRELQFATNNNREVAIEGLSTGVYYVIGANGARFKIVVTK